MSGPGLLYQVQDILTPYGPMNVAMIPLPADVVEAMAKSIVDVKDQIKPRMVLVSSQTSFSLGITEGDPMQSVGAVQIRNDGGFGSFLSAIATPDVPWLSVSTPEIAGIAKGETASFSINLVPDVLLATGSPFVGHVRIQDAADPSSYVVVSVNVLVIPRPEISVSTLDVAMTWSVETMAASLGYIVVSNSGPGTSNLEFSALKVANSSWLSVAPDSGGPLAAGASTTLILTVSGSTVPASLGDHVETVRISSPNASNSPVDVRVTLTVTL